MQIYDQNLGSRLMLGTARYPSPQILQDAIVASGAEIVTVSLRREADSERAGQKFWDIIREAGVRVLPKTAGCHSVREAVTTAQMAREVFATNWIKLEVIGDADTLQPDLSASSRRREFSPAKAFRCSPIRPKISSLPTGCSRPDAGC